VPSLYYFAPNLDEQKFCWVLPGMVVGVTLWLAASLGFCLDLRYFNTYNAVYGSLGAVNILMLWFYLTGAAILIGGEDNSEIEKTAAKAGEPDAKLPVEKSPGQKRRRGADGAGAAGA
jgi:membrane protein